MHGLRKVGYEHMVQYDTLVPIDVAMLRMLQPFKDGKVWATCPRTCLLANAISLLGSSVAAAWSFIDAAPHCSCMQTLLYL